MEISAQVVTLRFIFSAYVHSACAPLRRGLMAVLSVKLRAIDQSHCGVWCLALEL